MCSKPVQSLIAVDPVAQKEALLRCYGPNFKYTEFQVMPSIVSVVVYTMVIAFGLVMLLVSPVSYDVAKVVSFFNFHQLRYLVKKILPQSGKGPSEG